jgi:hypothetical protein
MLAVVGGVLPPTMTGMMYCSVIETCRPIMLASGDVEEARLARDQLHELTEAFDTDVLRAVVAQADGARELSLSERTIDRHVTKYPDQAQRALPHSCTTYAYDHKLF